MLIGHSANSPFPPARVAFLVTGMVGHLGFQRPFQHRLGHLVEQFLNTQRTAIRLGVFHQCVQRFRRQRAGEEVFGEDLCTRRYSRRSSRCNRLPRGNTESCPGPSEPQIGRP